MKTFGDANNLEDLTTDDQQKADHQKVVVNETP